MSGVLNAGYRPAELLEWANTEVQVIAADATGWWITFADADGVMPETPGKHYESEDLVLALTQAKKDQERMIAEAEAARRG